MSALVVRAGDFETANQRFDEGKFGDAKDLYQRLIYLGEWSANIFYDLGNAEYRAGSPGRAALSYERALALDGVHAEARANLRWLREQTGARVPARRWWERAFPPFTEDWFALAAVLAGWAFVFSLVAALFGRRPWGLGTLSVLVAAYSVCGVWLRERDSTLAIVTAKDVSARVAPADRAAVSESLPPGSRVRVLSERGNWIYCALPGGGLGWIGDGQIEKIRLTGT